MKKLLLITILLSSLIQANELTAKICTASAKEAQKLFYIQEKITKEEFHKILKPLCNAGCGQACMKLGGQLGTEDSNIKGCQAKFPYGYSCFSLSIGEDNKEKKYKLLQKGCELGHYDSCSKLGILFEGDKNYGNALEMYSKSCKTGLYQSCFSLGTIYSNGKYGEINNKKAYKYFSMALEREEKLSEHNGDGAILKENLKIVCQNAPSVCK